MKAIVFGCWGIGHAVLRAVLRAPGWEVPLVLTRGFDATSRDPWRNLVWSFARDRRIALQACENLDEQDLLCSISSIDPDLFLVAAYPRLLGSAVLAVPRLGALNLHGSLLPRNRGTSPVNWVLIRDEREVGLTLHYINERMDAGDIVFQEAVRVEDSDSLGSLADRLREMSPRLVTRALVALRAGHTLPRERQDENCATRAPRLKHEDCRIDWRHDARRVWSLVRGTAQPNLGAWTRWRGKEVVIWEATPENDGCERGAPGRVVSSDHAGVRVACGFGSLCVPPGQIRWRREGRACPLTRGDLLEDVPLEAVR